MLWFEVESFAKAAVLTHESAFFFFFFFKYSSLSLSEGIISLTGTVVDQVPITILRDTYDTMWCSAFSDQISYGSDLLVWEIK